MLFLFSFNTPPIGSPGRDETLPEGRVKMLVHAGLGEGAAHQQGIRRPPTSHWLWVPLSRAGGDIWQPASRIQVCRGKMDRNAPLGEDSAFLRSMPARSTAPGPVQGRCAEIGRAHV